MNATKSVILTLALLLSGCGGSNVPTSSSGMTTWLAEPTSTNDSKSRSLLFIANNGYPDTAIDVFDRGDLAKGPVRRVTDQVMYPEGIFVDHNDSLYVANGEESGHDVVTMYSKSGKLLRTYKGLKFASDVVAGGDGTVYAGDCDGKRVLEYAPNSTKRIRTVAVPGCVIGLTLDAKNNLYVGYHVGIRDPSQVRRFAPGATKGADMLLPKTVYFIGGIGIDKNGYLVVVNQDKGVVEVFSKPKAPPTRTINTGQRLPYRFAFNRDETVLYVSSPFEGSPRRRSVYEDAVRGLTSSGPELANTVVEVTYPAGKQVNVFQFGQDHYGYPTGVAITPPAPL